MPTVYTYVYIQAIKNCGFTSQPNGVSRPHYGENALPPRNGMARKLSTPLVQGVLELSSKRLGIPGERCFSKLAPVELGCLLNCFCLYSFARLRISAKQSHSLAQSVRIVWVQQKPSLSYHFGEGGSVCGDHRRTRLHCFKHTPGK